MGSLVGRRIAQRSQVEVITPTERARLLVFLRSLSPDQLAALVGGDGQEQDDTPGAGGEVIDAEATEEAQG